MISNSDRSNAARQRPSIVWWAGALLGLVGAAMVANGVIAMAGEGSVYPAALIALAVGAAVIGVAGGVLAGRPLARPAGLLLAAVVGLVTLAGLPGRAEPAVIAISVAVVAANAFVVWALAATGDWFGGRRS